MRELTVGAVFGYDEPEKAANAEPADYLLWGARIVSRQGPVAMSRAIFVVYALRP
jgi:hypothetical protein